MHILLLSLILTACMENPDTSAPSYTSTSEAGEIWTAELYAPKDALTDINIWDDYIYYYIAYPVVVDPETGERTKEPTTYYRLKIGSTETPEQIELSGFGALCTGSVLIQPDYEGNLYVLYGKEKIGKYDESGNELYLEEMPPVSEHIGTNSITIDDEGHLYISTVDSVYLFNKDCTHKGTIDAAEIGCNGLVHLDDRVYFYSLAGLYEISFDNASIGERIVTDRISSPAFGYSEDALIYIYSDNIYLFDKSTHKTEQFITLSECGVECSVPFYKIALLNDGRIVLVTRTGQLAVLSVEENFEKQIITIGTFESTSSLQNRVAEFNRSSDKYLLKIKQYYDRLTDTTVGGTGYQDAVIKFNLDIVSGNCPDIINLSYDSVVTYADKDLFEDLTPYIEASGLSITENLLDAYTFDDAIVSLPAVFQLHTIVGRTADLDGISGWTLEEMMEYVKNNGDKTVFAADSNVMLEYCLKLNLSDFVNWNSFTCDFENEEFYRILEFCSEFNGGPSYVNTHPQVNITEYDALLYEVTLASPSEYAVLQQLLNDENITFVGFPTDSGSGTLIEENSSPAMANGSYAIFSGSNNKEGAWAFIEFLLTDVHEYAYNTLRYGYPVENSTRAATFEKAMSDPWMIKIETTDGYAPTSPAYNFSLEGAEQWIVLKKVGKTTYERRAVGAATMNGRYSAYFVPFEDELEHIIDLIDTADAAITNSTILDIISENAADYFSGEKSAEETAKQIQSRVMLYLGEIK